MRPGFPLPLWAVPGIGGTPQKDTDSPSSPFADERTLGSKDGILVAWESYMGELSRQRPVLVVLDDLQKADSCTLRLLDYLVRSTDKEGPRFIATVCNEDIVKDEEGRSNISDFLSNASLDGRCRTVELGELSGGQRQHGIGKIPVQPAEGTRGRGGPEQPRKPADGPGTDEIRGFRLRQRVPRWFVTS